MNSFVCTLVPGLEEVAANEIKSKIKDVQRIKTLRGKVFFDSECQKEVLFQLDCVDNIYFFIKSFKIGAHKKDLKEFQKMIGTLHFDNVLEYMGGFHEKCILVSASRKGKQTYSRFDISAAATQVLVEKNHFIEGTVSNHNLPVRIDVIEHDCMVSVQLTPASFKFRGDDYCFMPGGIRPTIASALIFLSNPTPEDVFYDPFCGSGTIPKERARKKCKRILASDYDQLAVKNARNNLPSMVRVFLCDATEMKVVDNSIDVIVSNIPFGKQVAVDDIGELYQRFLKEAKRVLSTNGRMVLLTSRDEIVEIAESIGFSISKLYTISLHGLLVAIYLLVPNS